MKNANNLLKDLLDREAIRELPARYCDCVWRNDIPALVKLFAPDGRFSMATAAQTNVAQGHAELLDFYARGLAMTPRPYIHNQVVELGKKGHAVGRCALELRSAKRDMEWLGAGYYLDHYVKLKGVWKFASREFTALKMLEEPAPAAVASKSRAAKAVASKAAPAASPRARRAKAKPAAT